MTLIFRFITKKFNQNFIYVESICCRKQDITLGQSQIFKTKFGVPPNFPVTAINIVNLSCGLNLEMGGLSIYFFPCICYLYRKNFTISILQYRYTRKICRRARKNSF